jgi:molybdenum cofactor cytidylyltransferase
MGFPKALLKWDEQKTFLEKICSDYAAFACEGIILVINKDLSNLILKKHLTLPKNISVVVNEQIELGRMYSLFLGISKWNQQGFCFVQNIDNPFVNANTLKNIFANRNDDHAIVPVCEGRRGHPILINKKIADRISALKNFDLTLKTIINESGITEVPVNDLGILLNLNTPEEYQKLFTS